MYVEAECIFSYSIWVSIPRLYCYNSILTVIILIWLRLISVISYEWTLIDSNGLILIFVKIMSHKAKDRRLGRQIIISPNLFLTCHNHWQRLIIISRNLILTCHNTNELYNIPSTISTTLLFTIFVITDTTREIPM